ncbi:MAG: hypothetical protein HY075_01845 [Deltaproteobacteria bacterium]|nr:hypothetical protein [Deltaproteobacteria bacterium]
MELAGRRGLLMKLAVLLALLFGAVSVAYVSETDIFMQKRAGEEIVQTHHLQRVDSWTTTKAGQPWRNFQWLSTVVFHGLSTLADDYKAVSVFRGLVVFLCLLLVNWCLVSASRDDYVATLLIAAFDPVFYVVCSRRFQVRPEMLVFLVTALNAALWLREGRAQAKALTGLALLVVAANLHAGVFPLALFTQLVFLWAAHAEGGLSTRAATAWSLAAPLAFLCTPFGTDTLAPLLTLARNTSYLPSANEDMWPLRARHFDFSYAGLSFWVWVPLTAATLATAARAARSRRDRLLTLAAAAMTAGVFLRQRLIVFQMLSLVPLLPATARLATRRTRQLVAAAFCAAGALFAIHVQHPNIRAFGLGVDRRFFPVRSAEFVRSEKPAPALTNNMLFGPYLIDRLREYPVALDQREDLYVHDFYPEFVAAQETPARFKEFLARHRLNVAIEKYPGVRATGLGERQFKFPIAEWALVFMDQASVVYLRRVAANEAIIRKWEYRLLFNSTVGDAEVDRERLLAERRHCVENDPENPRCAPAPGQER